MNHIYFVRHGENKSNTDKQFSYQTVNYPLNDKGRQQAAQTAAHFATQTIHEIYTSPLKRAVETATIIAEPLGLSVNIREAFREINVGILDGQPATELANWQLHNRVIDDWFAGKSETAFPEGENYLTLLGRMEAGLREIVAQKDDRHIIIVGHGGIFSTTLKDICPNVNPIQLRHQGKHNCSITKIKLALAGDKLQGELITWADHSHLHGEAAALITGAPAKDELQ